MHRKIFLIIIFLNFSLFTSALTDNTAKGIDRENASYSVKNSNSSEGDVYYLTLEEVSRLALSNNFDIQLAQFDAQFKETDLDSVSSIYDTFLEAEAKIKDDQNKSASSFAGTKTETRDFNLGLSKKLPTGSTLGLDFDNQRSWTNSAFTTVNPVHDSSVTLVLKQELGKNFFGIRDRSNVKITKLDIQNAQYTSLDKIEQVLGKIQKTYWKIAQYLHIVKIRESMLNKASELFQINKQKMLRGIIEQPQLVASEANLTQREIDLILTQNDLRFHINELKLLLNLEDRDKDILPKEDFDGSTLLAIDPERSRRIDLVIQPIELNQAFKTAFIQRRDFLKAKNEVESKKIKLVMQKNNLWPEINLEASIARNGLNEHLSSAIRDITSEDNPEYYLGLKIRFPIENREARSEFNKANIEKAKALLNLKKTERQILIQIKDSVRNCKVLEERLRKQEKVVNLQERKLTGELKSYQYGRSDTDTVIRYQDDLLVSQILYTQALFDYKQALIELALKENILLDRFWKDVL